MRELELFTLLKSIIETAEPDFRIPRVNDAPGVPVYQSYQPTQQGVPTGPCAIIEIITTEEVGQPLREDYFDDEADPPREIHKETQQLVTYFQLGALATQNTASLTQLTAGDIVNLMKMILKNSQTIQQLVDAGCGIVLEKNARNPKFLNDSNRFQASPSFDFQISHKLIVTREQPVLQSQELQIIAI